MYKEKITDHYIEFASRWKRELSPQSVSAGGSTGRLLGANKGLESRGQLARGTTNSDLLSNIKQGREISRQRKNTLNSSSKTKNKGFKSLAVNENLINQARPNKRGVLKTTAAPYKVKIATKAELQSRKAAQRSMNAARELDSMPPPPQTSTALALRPAQTQAPKPLASSPIPTPKPTPFVNSAPKLQGSGLLKSVTRKNKIIAGTVAGLGVAALGAGIYKRMRDKNRNK